MSNSGLSGMTILSAGHVFSELLCPSNWGNEMDYDFSLLGYHDREQGTVQYACVMSFFFL